jgi:hypothetical protein
MVCDRTFIKHSLDMKFWWTYATSSVPDTSETSECLMDRVFVVAGRGERAATWPSRDANCHPLAFY